MSTTVFYEPQKESFILLPQPEEESHFSAEGLHLSGSSVPEDELIYFCK